MEYRVPRTLEEKQDNKVGGAREFWVLKSCRLIAKGPGLRNCEVDAYIYNYFLVSEPTLRTFLKIEMEILNVL